MLCDLVKEKRLKLQKTFFERDFVAFGINANSSFFSQISSYDKKNVCVNFEENQKGPLIGENFCFIYNFFRWIKFLIFFWPFCLGFDALSFDAHIVRFGQRKKVKIAKKHLLKGILSP